MIGQSEAFVTNFCQFCAFLRVLPELALWESLLGSGNPDWPSHCLDQGILLGLNPSVVMKI